MKYKKIMIAIIALIVILVLALLAFFISNGANGNEKEQIKITQEYTWAEFKAMSPEEQEQFFENFESAKEFEAWEEEAKIKDMQDSAPWAKDGAKQPKDYTWSEFENLSAEEQEMFFEWFDSAEEFEEWKSNAMLDTSNENMPWNQDGAKKPDEYTIEEFNALSGTEQEAFFEWFGSAEAFDEWQNEAKGKESTENAEWETEGSKQPDEYTWKEFESLSAEEKEAFFEWFDSPEDFEDWKSEAKANEMSENAPWHKENAKQPNEYTLSEFESLTAEEQEMFFEWFESAEEFEEWMETADP